MLFPSNQFHQKRHILLHVRLTDQKAPPEVSLEKLFTVSTIHLTKVVYFNNLAVPYVDIIYSTYASNNMYMHIMACKFFHTARNLTSPSFPSALSIYAHLHALIRQTVPMLIFYEMKKKHLCGLP